MRLGKSDHCVGFWPVFLGESSNHACETNGNVSRVVSALKEEDDNLERNQLVGNALVDEV